MPDYRFIDKVSAAANIATNTAVVGDDGAKGVKSATGAVTIPTINLTGGQIAFPVTAVPSADPNTLDDYEEGTWTPTIIGSAGGTTQVYTTQTGNYTKIGRLVTLVFYVVLSSKGDIAGNIYIGNFPFTTLAGLAYSAGSMYWGALTTALTTLVYLLPPGGTYMQTYGAAGAVTSHTLLGVADISNTTAFASVITYYN